MAITLADFNKIWASTSPLTPYSFSESNYKQGWNFIGSTPPARQMWDFLQKNNDEKMQYLANNYLPLSGGTMTGYLTMGTEYIKRNVDNASLTLCGGTSHSNGAYVSLNGKDRSVNAGVFSLLANNGTNSKTFYGTPDGTLTWDGKILSAQSGRILTAYGTVEGVKETTVDIASIALSKAISDKWLVVSVTDISISVAGSMFVSKFSITGGAPVRFDGSGGGGAVNAIVVNITSDTNCIAQGYGNVSSTLNFRAHIWAIPLM